MASLDMLGQQQEQEDGKSQLGWQGLKGAGDHKDMYGERDGLNTLPVVSVGAAPAIAL